MGRIQGYVPPDVEDAGIMPMDASGQIGSGSYWINWNSNGYSGRDWFWKDPNNYLATGWGIAIGTSGKVDEKCTEVHSPSFDGFQQHIQDCSPDDLNVILGSWSDSDKLKFLQAHDEVFDGCVTAV